MDTYSPLTLSTKPTSIMCLNILLPIMGLLLIGEPMVALLAQMLGFWKGLVELSLLLALSDVRIFERTVSVTGIVNHELPGLDVVTCAAPIMAKWFSSCMNMPIMVEAAPSTLQVKVSGSRTPVMTNPSVWDGNTLSSSLMDLLLLSSVGQVSCI